MSKITAKGVVTVLRKNKDGIYAPAMVQPNMVVNGGLEALAETLTGNNSFAGVTMKMGSSAAAVSATQTNLFSPYSDVGTELSKSSGYSANYGYYFKLTCLFSPTGARTYTETGLFQGTLMIARALLLNPVNLISGDDYPQSWVISFTAS